MYTSLIGMLYHPSTLCSITKIGKRSKETIVDSRSSSFICEHSRITQISKITF